MRVAKVTAAPGGRTRRQRVLGWYELGLDLRAETPPGPAAPTFGPVPCEDDTPGLEEQDFCAARQRHGW